MENQQTNHVSIIRNLLKLGHRLTVLDYFKTHLSFELRHYIAILRKEMKIADEWKTNYEGKRYKVYWLSK